MTQDADILIVGGGLSGPALAIALARGGQRVALVDAQPVATRADTGFDGRAYALALASVRLLRALDVWPRIEEQAQPILEVKACDGRVGAPPSPLFLHFDHTEIEEGPLGHMVEDRHLRRALLDAMAETPGITHLPGARVTAQAVGPGAIAVTLDDGRRLSGRVLAGCDGRRSGTAERAGIRRLHSDYGQTALVCTIAHERPHHGIAHQLFLPPGPLAILPLRGNRASVVWSERTATARRIAALDDAGYLDVLRPRFGSFLGEIRLEGPRWSYPLGLSLALSHVAERVALVGDAAHGMHPIAGQGLNMGLRDVAALAETLLTAARRGEDIGHGSVLEAYQRWRRFDNTTMALATDTFNRLFSNDNPILRGIRDLGLGLAGSVPPLRRGLMRRAAGLGDDDMPRLLRGLPV